MNPFLKFESRGNFNKNAIMLIGERYSDDTNVGENPNRKALLGPKGCGPYFERLIRSTKYYEDFYITNALKTLEDKINQKYLNEEIDLIQPRKIITLGQKADKFLQKMNINHPQWIKRFHYHQIEEYSKMLTNIIEKGK